ncbi:MAG: hypothetical protein FJ390_03775 [Verrucomicrobia bacterium]|nr:hypothetical protein [Verrucomicrobiota bacterium]
MNASTLQHLSSSLSERLRLIADHEFRDRDPAAHLKKLQEASEVIERCEVLLLSEGSVDPKLRHYLKQRSYDKALTHAQSLLKMFREDGD